MARKLIPEARTRVATAADNLCTAGRGTLRKEGFRFLFISLPPYFIFISSFLDRLDLAGRVHDGSFFSRYFQIIRAAPKNQDFSSPHCQARNPPCPPLELWNNPLGHPHPSPPPSRGREIILYFNMFTLSPRGRG
jgi:hypothetical protein